MRLAHQGISFFALATLTACTATIAQVQLKQIVERQSMRSWPCDILYCGSKDGYDYFQEEEIGLVFSKSVKKYRVPLAQEAISNRFPYTSDRTKWRSLLKYSKVGS